MRIPSVTLCVLLCTFISSCNKDDIIVDNGTLKPIIILDNVSGVYNVKVGKELSISPTYRNADDALFSWTIDGKLVSNQKLFLIHGKKRVMYLSHCELIMKMDMPQKNLRWK